MSKKEKAERDCMAHQMITFWIIFTSGKKDIKTSLKKLKMDNKKYHQMAREFRLDWVADEIEKIIKI